MSYYVQALMTQDREVTMRLTAAAASSKIPDPSYWVQNRIWELSALTGWVEAYGRALAVTPVKPGANEQELTDQMILTGITSMAEGEKEVANLP